MWTPNSYRKAGIRRGTAPSSSTIPGTTSRGIRALIPAASREPETTIRDAGHFLQEDKGEEIAEHVIAFLKRRPA